MFTSFINEGIIYVFILHKYLVMSSTPCCVMPLCLDCNVCLEYLPPTSLDRVDSYSFHKIPHNHHFLQEALPVS